MENLESLPQVQRGPYGVPVGTVDLFGGKETPDETRSSTSWTDQIPNGCATNSTGADSTTEDDEECESGLTYLQNPTY